QGIDFFPLGVFYQERAYAAGKIPGGFFKREARPTEKETLTSRLIDRPIRPLFADSFRNETQVICTVVSHDLKNNPDIAALIGASAALTISGIPFLGPIGACRVGYRDGEFLFNPTRDEMADSQLDLVVAGTRKGVLMVESEAHELSEEVMLSAVMAGHNHYQAAIDTIIELAEQVAKDPWDLPQEDPAFEKLAARVRSHAEKGMREAYGITKKQDRQAALGELRKQVVTDLQDDETTDDAIAKQVKYLEKDIVRNQILDSGVRIDGRKTTDIRPIDCRVGVLGRSHGSALFTRGETQALVVTTLGTGQDEQIMDSLDGEYRQHFLLHYNFPPYSVGETGRMAGPGRREIGHGKLAWR
ncbi:MAG: polyribonucleotide nucleotidyltransferase, partial [Pseudomonadota bacterium]